MKSVQIRSFFWCVFFRIFLVCIFWSVFSVFFRTEYLRISPYLSVVSPNAGNYWSEKNSVFEHFLRSKKSLIIPKIFLYSMVSGPVGSDISCFFDLLFANAVDLHEKTKAFLAEIYLLKVASKTCNTLQNVVLKLFW